MCLITSLDASLLAQVVQRAIRFLKHAWREETPRVVLLPPPAARHEAARTQGRLDLILAASPVTRDMTLAASLSRCSRSRCHQGAAGISGGAEGLYPRASVQAKLGE